MATNSDDVTTEHNNLITRSSGDEFYMKCDFKRNLTTSLDGGFHATSDVVSFTEGTQKVFRVLAPR